jgi:hypothetical protein
MNNKTITLKLTQEGYERLREVLDDENFRIDDFVISNDFGDVREIKMKYLFRCDGSGVFYGEKVEIEGQRAKIKNARKIYYWDGANCLEQLCMEGTKKPENCKFTMAVDEIEVFDLIQILPCTEQARASIEGVPKWTIR